MLVLHLFVTYTLSRFLFFVKGQETRKVFFLWFFFEESFCSIFHFRRSPPGICCPRHGIRSRFLLAWKLSPNRLKKNTFYEKLDEDVNNSQNTIEFTDIL